MNFLSTGFIRGLLAQIVGTIFGAAIVAGVRAVTGSDPFSNVPAMAVAGGVLGALAFMVGVGAVSDWMKWARGIPTSDDHDPDPNKPNWMRYFSVDYDHKVIGIQYGVTSFVFLGLAGTFALIFRTELLDAGLKFITAGTFNSLMSLHGIVMIGSILLGVGALSNYLVPLMIG
ncbi:MAG: cbb3-type cytochrome c oxidase subunit I, partial [Anaerolineae bacterium]|nr:cbb3-type cytochrome c oxidase subunit I [Anaerolineae bacterium]